MIVVFLPRHHLGNGAAKREATWAIPGKVEGAALAARPGLDPEVRLFFVQYKDRRTKRASELVFDILASPYLDEDRVEKMRDQSGW